MGQNQTDIKSIITQESHSRKIENKNYVRYYVCRFSRTLYQGPVQNVHTYHLYEKKHKKVNTFSCPLMVFYVQICINV